MPGVVETATRKPLAEMDPGELRQGLPDRRQQLVHHKRFIRRYLHRRARLSAASRSILTGNIRFQVLSSDLLELLDGVIGALISRHDHNWLVSCDSLNHNLRSV